MFFILFTFLRTHKQTRITELTVAGVNKLCPLRESRLHYMATWSPLCRAVKSELTPGLNFDPSCLNILCFLCAVELVCFIELLKKSVEWPFDYLAQLAWICKSQWSEFGTVLLKALMAWFRSNTCLIHWSETDAYMRGLGGTAFRSASHFSVIDYDFNFYIIPGHWFSNWQYMLIRPSTF